MLIVNVQRSFIAVLSTRLATPFINQKTLQNCTLPKLISDTGSLKYRLINAIYFAVTERHFWFEDE